MIRVEELEKSYSGRRVVDKLSFHVGKGEILALLGSSGAGKSTTIKMILGLVRPDGGDIQVSQNLKVGYSPETLAFPPFLTGKEMLTFYTRLQGRESERKSSLLCC